MYVVEPSVLAHREKQFQRLLRTAQRLSPRVHIDITDGSLTRSRGISASTLSRAGLSRQAAVHLMVMDPAAWFPAVKASGSRRVILHVEIPAKRLRQALQLYRRAGFRVGLGITLSTPISALQRVSGAPWAHVMLGSIGSYGATMSPRAVARVTAVRTRHPRWFVSCDIGLRPATIAKIVAAGAQEIIVGSFLARSRKPRQRWAELQAQRRTL